MAMPIIKLDDVRQKIRSYGFDIWSSAYEDSTALHMARLKHGPRATVSYSTKFCHYYIKK